MEKISADQQIFLDAVMQGKNIYLSGFAGTGKSFILNKAIKMLRDKGKNVAAVAPTGIAANNISGQTIHSLFQLKPYGVLTYDDCNYLKGEKRKLIDKIDVLIIDEISMLRPDVLDAMNFTLIKNGCRKLLHKQIIFCGDLKQLPSPIDDNTQSVLRQTYDGNQFYHAKIFHSLNIENIELKEILRQTDHDFIKALNVIRDGGKDPYFKQFVHKEPKGVILAPHNTTVSSHNIKGLASIPGEPIIMKATIEGNVKAAEFNFEVKIEVKNGSRIMFLMNQKDNNLRNGTIGIFRVIDGKYFIDVKGVEYAIEPIVSRKMQYVLDDNEEKLEMKEVGSITQYPIKLAYALTIHKAQGLTFDYVTLDLSRPCFSEGQMYTALSRVKTPQGLRIII